MELEERIERIERILIEQLSDRKHLLDGELTYAKGRARRDERRIQTIEGRLAAVSKHMEALYGS